MRCGTGHSQKRDRTFTEWIEKRDRTFTKAGPDIHKSGTGHHPPGMDITPRPTQMDVGG